MPLHAFERAGSAPQGSASAGPKKPKRSQSVDSKRQAEAIRLGQAPVGLRGTIVGIDVPESAAGIAAEELERRLLEMGFVEGTEFAILHQGLIRRDPIAVRLGDMRVALRRREADAVLVRPMTDASVEQSTGED
jgi:ferrous iron transport protein A